MSFKIAELSAFSKAKLGTDINGQPLVREVEPEDLDNIGEAVMATIVDGV